MDWLTATRRASQRARQTGALAPLDTFVESVTEQGMAYVVRVFSHSRRKRQANAGQIVDPFAPPYEPDLVIGALAPAHMALLNKFPVLDQHLLAVTRVFEPQTDLLTPADCQALLHLLRGWNGLVFYNGGPDAGASQPHKHLQMVGLSAKQDQFVAQALAAGPVDNEIGCSPVLPFPHACVRMPNTAWQNPPASAATVHQLYLGLLDAIGWPAHGMHQPGPYNLLATRDWLWLVPRSRPAWQGIEVNALGFAGTLLVSDRAHLERLKALGIVACLCRVCA